MPREVLIDDLAAGDCFDEHAGSLDTGTVLVADCTVAHGGEVIAVHSVAEVFHDFFPGDEALTAEADARCGPAVGEAAAGAGLGDAALRYSYYFPTERDWDAGSRLVQCNLVGGSGGSLTGSLTAGTLSAW
ncbi:septum formation family protein [Kineococcus sp. SYSU DK018]|uniref:septum formation family protein n=1 Tax=Kineococcus sp. SYSU DK018 TaxID=3383139 RepID=UPI003D7DDC75